MQRRSNHTSFFHIRSVAFALNEKAQVLQGLVLHKELWIRARTERLAFQRCPVVAKLWCSSLDDGMVPDTS
jgi:hypothetical protein